MGLENKGLLKWFNYNMDAKSQRDAKLEELKKLKSRNNLNLSNPLSVPNNPVLTKPEAMPEEPKPLINKPVIPTANKKFIPPKIQPKPIQVPSNPFGRVQQNSDNTKPSPAEESGSSNPAVPIQSDFPAATDPKPPKETEVLSPPTQGKETNQSSKPNKSSAKATSDHKLIQSTIPKMPFTIKTQSIQNPQNKPKLLYTEAKAVELNQADEETNSNCAELDEVLIQSLNKQLDVLQVIEEKLLASNERAKEENKKLKEEKENFDLNMENLAKISENLIQSLDEEFERFQGKIRKFDDGHGSLNKALVAKEIEELTNEIDFFLLQSEEKEEEIERLKKEIQKANLELESLNIDAAHLSQPEPPPPVYNPVMDSHSIMPRRLLSDMGSTGAWNNKKKKT